MTSANQHQLKGKNLSTYLHHFSCGAVWQEGFFVRSPLLPESVGVVPVVLVPGGQKPNVALALSHTLLVRLAHDVSSRSLEKLPDDDADAALSQVVQVLQQ